jgi:DNA polymerase-1
MVGTVHDEALLELPESITQDQAKEIETAMTSAATLEVPLKVDVAFMYEWGKEIGKKTWFENIQVKNDKVVVYPIYIDQKILDKYKNENAAA